MASTSLLLGNQVASRGILSKQTAGNPQKLAGSSLLSRTKVLRRSSSDRRNGRVVMVTQATGRGLSANFRSFKFGVQDKANSLKKKVMENPKVAEMLQWWASSVAAPVMAVWSIYHRWQTIEVERYREFLGEETKREWSWKRHTEKEWALWVRVVNFVAVLLVSLMWQVLVPVSFVLSLGLPMFISYIVWGNPFWSPVGLSLLLIAPLKWLPCVQWVWLL